MRMLSFFNQVEMTLAMLKPECAFGWRRRAHYQTGTATYWNDQSGLALNLHTCDLGGGRYSLATTWSDRTGSALHHRTFFCGPKTFDWQTAADAVAEAMPEPSELPTDTPLSTPDSILTSSA
jgi:hypothetical protein